MKNKTYNRTQKIIIAIIIVLSFNFVVPTFSRATGVGEAIKEGASAITGSLVDSVGGILLKPFASFICFIGDAIVGGLQNFMYDDTSGLGILSGFLKNPSNLNELQKKYPELVPKHTDEKKTITVNEDDLENGLTGLGTYGIPVIVYSPEKIFAGQVPALDVNFISPTDWSQNKDDVNNSSQMNNKSIARALHETIASWYVALRNLAIVGLLSVLLYVGIRMVISSTSSDKAKYKQMLMDWIVSLCILFFLHYIMSFTLTFTQMITQGISDGESSIVINVEKGRGTSVEETGGGTVNPGIDGIYDDKNKEKDEKTTMDSTFATSLMGAIRFQVQYSDFGHKMVYLIMYIALVAYTVMFTWKYMKRAITMAFLTLIAPLVALTYPIDKIGDGKSQAFNMWLKEYIFNALLQPFHLILYTIFLGSAMEIAVENPVYAIFFLAFITPAEKILRKFFGFEKSSTVGALDSAGKMFGGAAAFKVVSGMMKKGANLVPGKTSNASVSKGVRSANQNVVNQNELGKDASAFTDRRLINGSTTDENVNASEKGTDTQSVQQNQLEDYDDFDMYMNPGKYKESGNLINARNSRVIQQPTVQPTMAGVGPSPQIREHRSPDIDVANRTAAMNQIEATGNRRNDITQNDKNIIRGVMNIPGKKFKAMKEKSRITLGTPEGRKQALKSAARFAGRTGARIGATAAGAALGIGLGIAGDDLEDVMSIGAAGTALGATVLGRATANAVENIGSNVSTDYMEGYYGDDNVAAVNRRHDEVFLDNEKRDYFGTELGVKGKELDNVMRDVAFYDTQGIKDNKAIKQALKLENSINKEITEINDKADKEELKIKEEEIKDFARVQAVTIAKLADNYDTGKLRTSEKYREDARKSFEKSLKLADSSLTPEQVKKQSKQMLNRLLDYKKIDHIE